jgi:hypothetical protein
LLMLLIILVFCFFYCFHGLLRERKFELLAFVGGTVVIFIYIVGNYVYEAIKHHDSITPVKKVSR